MIRGVIRRILQWGSACRFYTFNALVSHLPGYWLRTLWLREVLHYRIGSGSSIHMGCFVTGSSITVGRNSVINRNCYLDGRGGLAIGDNVSISPEVYILTASHDVDSPKFQSVMAPVCIEDRVWIGARAVILPGVKLSIGTVVGAGSVVARTTEPYSVVVGNPARVVRKRNADLTYALRYFPWFNTDVGL